MRTIDRKERDQYIIEHYQAGEKGMILLFAQWCLNHQLDPYVLYEQAYPNQAGLTLLGEIMAHTVDPKEADPIETALLIDALQAYGNDALVFVIMEYLNRDEKNK